MAVAASHSTSMELLSVLDQAGADVVAIDVRAWALARACSPNPWRLTGVVELGWASGRLVVLHEGSVVYERILEEWSLRALYEAMANVLETDVANVRALLDAPEFVDVPKDRRAGGDPLAAARRALLASIEALAKEIGVSFRYIEHRFANDVGPGEVGGVHVCGPGASLPGLVKELAERIGVRTSQASPSTLIRFPTEGIDGPAGIGRGSDLVVALGLAMWKEVGA